MVDSHPRQASTGARSLGPPQDPVPTLADRQAIRIEELEHRDQELACGSEAVSKLGDLQLAVLLAVLGGRRTINNKNVPGDE